MPDDIVEPETDPLLERPLRTNNLGKDVDPNSKVERKKLESVVEGEVIQRKRSLWRKFTETFTGDDAKSVGQYVFFDVMVPAFKEMVVDMGREGLERMFFGDSRHHGRSSSERKPYTPYGNVSYRGRDERDREPERSFSRRDRASHNFKEIVLPTRGEAEEVIERLGDAIEQYGTATVEDLYDLVGISGSFTDVKYGWTTARGMSADRVRNGFYLNLPSPQLID
jgi:hypothetical protein